MNEPKYIFQGRYYLLEHTKSGMILKIDIDTGWTWYLCTDGEPSWKFISSIP